MNKAISAIIMKFLARAGVAVSGPVGWIVSIFVNKFIIFAEKAIREVLKNIKDKLKNDQLKKEDEKNEQKYNEVINSETKTEADIDSATSDFLNSGMQNNGSSKNP